MLFDFFNSGNCNVTVISKIMFVYSIWFHRKCATEIYICNFIKLWQFSSSISENIPSKKCPKMPKNILLSSCLTKHVLTTRFHRNYTWILSLQFLSNLEVCIHLVLWTHQTWYETHWNEFQGNQTREKLIWSRFLFGLKLMWKILGLLFSWSLQKF